MTLTERRQVADISAREDAPKVIEAVALNYGVDVNELTGHSHKRRLYPPRAEGMFLLRMMGLTLKGIGAYFDGRDHSTVWAALRKYENG